MKSVSVVVPTRNRSNLLGMTLRSVLWQRGVEFEVIVVDDASTDDTALVTELVDPRVTIVRHSVPSGPSVARNSGAARASGEWLGFVDDDDLWAPDKLARQVAAADKLQREWAYTGAVNIGGALEIVSGGPPPTPEQVVDALPRYNPVPGGGSNVVLHRRLFQDVGGFDERLPPCEDWELWARLAQAGPPARIGDPLMAYRLHSESSSLDTGRIIRAARLIEELHGESIDWGRLHRWLGESCLRTEHHARAVTHFLRAAMRGQAVGVAADLAAVVRRKITRRERGLAPEPGNWAKAARPWLEELARLPLGAGEETGGP